MYDPPPIFDMMTGCLYHQVFTKINRSIRQSISVGLRGTYFCQTGVGRDNTMGDHTFALNGMDAGTGVIVQTQ